MQKIALALASLLLVAGLSAQTQLNISQRQVRATGVTQANLPGSPTTGEIALLTDGTSNTDCTVGGGSSLVLCRYNGSVWAAVGGGLLTIDISDDTNLAVTAPVVLTDDTLSLTQNAGTDITADLEEESHASEHQHGGADEVATATPGANAIPKAEADGDLNSGWIGQDQAYTWTATHIFDDFQDRGSQVYDIQAYGAACDGVTDDATDIQSAIDAAESAGGGTVFIPEGTCVISSGLTIDSNNVFIRGTGMGASIIAPDFASGDAITFSGVLHGGMSDLEIDSSTTRTADAHIKVDSASALILFRDLRIEDPIIGFEIDASSLVYMDRIRVQSTVATTGKGFLFTGASNDIYLNEVTMDGASDAGFCLDVQNVNALYVRNSGFIDCGIGMDIHPGDTELVKWLWMDNSQIDSGSGTGIVIDPDHANGVIYSIYVSDSWISTNTGDGVLIQNTNSAGSFNSLKFSNNRIYNNGTHGVNIAADNLQVTIVGGEIAGNSTASSGTSSGVRIAPNVGDVLITGVEIGQCCGLGNTQNFGVLVGSGTGDNISITANKFGANVNGAVSFAATGATTTVLGNDGYGTNILDGNLNINNLGRVLYGPSSGEPVNCSTANDGSEYFDTSDQKLCICVNDGTDNEWVFSDDYSHATGHCSI